jgi:serine/threonine protein kinase
MQAELVGKSLGHYKVLEQIARGGMATVYKGADPVRKRAVAIKVLPAYFAHNAQFARRFQREARAAARLEHDHIVRVYESGEAFDISYIVMEYVGGGTLKNLLLQEGLTLDRAALVMKQIASALAYAHKEGIIHRDVKPSNVLMATPDHAKLSDFGIAKFANEDTALTALTGTGVGVGTAAYMAPEQAVEAANANHRADIYSLGVMLYEMIAGCLPYNADTPMGLLAQHLYEPIPSIRRDAPQAPQVIEHILFKALAKDPDQRFDSPVALAKAFSDALAQKPVVIDLPDSAPRISTADEATSFARPMVVPDNDVPEYDDEPLTVIAVDTDEFDGTEGTDISRLLGNMSAQHQAVFTRALKAFDAGDLDTSRRLVLRILNDDDHVSEAWLLRSYLEENWYDQMQCARNALASTPDSADAKLRVEQLEAVRLPMMHGTRVVSMIPAVREAHDAVMDDFFLDSRMEDAVDPLDHPGQCPYCGVVNEPARTACSSCHKSLMRIREPLKKVTDSLNTAIMLNLASTVMIVMQLLPPLIWTWYLQIERASRYMIGVETILDQQAMILITGSFTDLMTNELFALLLGAGLARGLLLVAAGIGLRFRGTWAYYTGLFLFGVEILWAVLATIMQWTGIVIGGASLLFAGAGLLALSAATVNFRVTTERYLVRPDGRLKSGVAYWQRGVEYQKRAMWAMAVVHFRAAVAAAPNVTRHYKSLGFGYNKLGRLDRAVLALEQALRLDPADPETQNMLRRVRELKAESEQSESPA